MQDFSTPSSLKFCFQEMGMEDLRHSLFYTTLELESTILSAKGEITSRENELLHLNNLLSRAIKEKDEAESQCQSLMLYNFICTLQHHLPQANKLLLHHEPEDSESNGSHTNTMIKCLALASPDCDDSTVQSSGTDPVFQAPVSPHLPDVSSLVAERPLPEKGKLLQAVIDAGPLLQTLLLAGPLPQWQHPPPQLDSIEILPLYQSPPSPKFILPN